ncbi:ACP S-malonyltransferase [Polynucleobacter kasalickyi]|uniref:Malonyl CoA-acyl carrier protein transacylase n=1 Tax=Polynucleobacter kasalickyi TaxID=1938817 RepID=A0A1W1YCF7_9BURK|nr:ACP S-malonyltransferase [Polynucleobacter kasalickyi]SMC33804.1 [Acyl-carrier-protein] S-malonyltransferase [Polynucleobacter kasalickyi]
MTQKLAFVFPGQGSQSVGMLNSFAQDVEVQKTIEQASASLGQDLGALIQDGPAEALALTENTQPVMLLSAVAVYRAWLAAGGQVPDLMAGHSLGEYTSLVCADSLDFAQAVPLVRFRARAMQEAVPVGSGGMAAIIGLSDDVTKTLCLEISQETGFLVEPVNFNAPNQVVVAGHTQAIEQIILKAKPAGAKLATKLPVSAPFHSSLLLPVAAQLEQYLVDVQLRTPSVQVINNVDVMIEEDPEKIKNALIRQAYSPVRWVETIEKMANLGVTHIVECGPGRVLAGLVKRIAPQIKILGISDPQTIQNVLLELKN